VLGYACLDHRFWAAALPPQRGRTPATAYRADIAGTGAVGALAVERLGGHAIFFGRRGEDAGGRDIEARLRAEGVDVAAFRAFACMRTPVSGIVIVPGGERYIFPYAGSAPPGDAGWLPLERLGSAGAVLADIRWPAGALRLAGAARALGLPVVIDLDEDTDDAWRVAAAATHVIADQELAAHCGGAEAAIERIVGLGAWGAVTLGAEGVAFPGGRLPAFPVAACDTTGAGDVFHAAFALALAEGQNEAFALTFASAAAAQRCALGDVPRRIDVIRFLEPGVRRGAAR
jgi:sulfofructose kinase